MYNCNAQTPLINFNELKVTQICTRCGIFLWFAPWGRVSAPKCEWINHLIVLLSCWWLWGVCVCGFSTEPYRVETSVLTHYHSGFVKDQTELQPMIVVITSLMCSSFFCLFNTQDTYWSFQSWKVVKENSNLQWCDTQKSRNLTQLRSWNLVYFLHNDLKR